MRVAAIADIHGDLDAFGRGLTAIDGAYTDQICCLGDIVGLGAPTAPGGVVELARDRCAIALARDRWVTGALRSLAARVPAVDERLQRVAVLDVDSGCLRRGQEPLRWTVGG